MQISRIVQAPFTFLRELAQECLEILFAPHSTALTLINLTYVSPLFAFLTDRYETELHGRDRESVKN